MDIREIKIKVIELRRALLDKKITPDIFILFGSYAKGTATKHSDIDLAIVSKMFGKDRFKESSKLNIIATKIDPNFEVIPIGLKDYFDEHNVSPILHEIRTYGTILL